MKKTPSMPRQIVLLSGKGGTGKTTLAAALSVLFKQRVMADTDVEAADLHILLKPQLQKHYPHMGSKKAFIDLALCTGCGLCQEYCRFKAIQDTQIDLFSCEGCGFCVQICPENAITLSEIVTGYYHEGLIEGGRFMDAIVRPGEGNSGKLVSQVKKRAVELAEMENTEWLIVDGPPGIGCPVNASLTGADLVVIVTEPTVSGLYDLERLLKLIQRFHIRAGIVVNKADLNRTICSQMKALTEQKQLLFLGQIPFDDMVVTALLNEKVVTDFPNSPATRAILRIFANICNFFNREIRSGQEVRA